MQKSSFKENDICDVAHVQRTRRSKYAISLKLNSYGEIK